MESPDLTEALKDWAELSKEYQEMEKVHEEYQVKLKEVIGLQKKCMSGVHHQRYRLRAIEKMMGHVNPTNKDELAEKDDLQKDVLKRKSQLHQMEECLPKESGTYLKIILGNVNVSILDKTERFNYKDQYEQFKLIVTLIGCMIAITNLYFASRVLDLVFMFLIVWYYCTLTIRESILKVNGSRIKGWWRAHHFISTVVGGVLLIWPDGDCYQEFRPNLMWFNVYLAFLQYLQFTYQRGCLYRLRSLGERPNDMDITIEGFHTWMWKGLGFLLPFLFVGYIWQLYNAYILYHLSLRPDATWQVPFLTLMFFVLGSGNILCCSYFIPTKIKESRVGNLKLRFTRLDKYFWRHKRRRDSCSNKKLIEEVDRILSQISRSSSSSDDMIEEEEEGKKES